MTKLIKLTKTVTKSVIRITHIKTKYLGSYKKQTFDYLEKNGGDHKRSGYVQYVPVI